MHLLTILAFAFVFWRAETSGQLILVPDQDVFWTLVVVLVQPALIGLTAAWVARRTAWLSSQCLDSAEPAQRFHHRATFALRLAIGAGFAAAVFLTRWPDWFAFERITPVLQIAGDTIVLTPFLANVLVLWVFSFPLEQTLRGGAERGSVGAVSPRGSSWRFSAYLDFHLRHYVLVVAVPMMLILFTANLTRGYESTLQDWSGWVWTPEAILGVVAVGVFVVAPVLLRRIWRTTPLEAGPVRERLDLLCRRIGLRFREILVWKSDGLMINAAVMGVFAPVRYVLLSDALLSTMQPRQIEAVFGHEAGHVRHHHMQHFLVFAVVGWLGVAGIMEFLAWLATTSDAASSLSVLAVEGVGVAATVVFWGVGFGWVSRRFERQADLFAARCATPAAPDCPMPCSVHPDNQRTLDGDGRVCATGAAIFASALDRVAVLNGIPHEERSWRHSSIGSRIRALMSMAGDPGRVARFERTVRWVKVVMLILAVVGAAACLYYWMTVPEPAILRLQTTGL